MQIGTIVKTRAQLYRNTASKSSHNNSIELPQEIDELIDNKMYRNKYRKMIRDGHLAALLELAGIAAGKEKSSHWFARVCSNRRWEGTLEWLRKAHEVAQNAAEVVRRLKVQPEQFKAVYKACWRFKNAVIQKAALAEEIVNERGGDKLRLFNWFCWRT